MYKWILELIYSIINNILTYSDKSKVNNSLKDTAVRLVKEDRKKYTEFINNLHMEKVK